MLLNGHMSAEWVSAAAAVLSLVFAVVSWVMKNLSRQARAEAEKASREAAEQLAEVKEQTRVMREQAEALKALAASTRQPPVVHRSRGETDGVLVNTTGEPVEVERIDNADAWMVVRPAGPFTIPPQGTVRVVTAPGGARTGDPILRLRLADGRVLVVPFDTPERNRSLPT